MTYRIPIDNIILFGIVVIGKFQHKPRNKGQKMKTKKIPFFVLMALITVFTSGCATMADIVRPPTSYQLTHACMGDTLLVDNPYSFTVQIKFYDQVIETLSPSGSPDGDSSKTLTLDPGWLGGQTISLVAFGPGMKNHSCLIQVTPPPNGSYGSYYYRATKWSIDTNFGG